MNTPSSNGMPGMGPMTDTLDFVKKLWGGMSVPGMAVPTVSVDELQQKITDLKTVESWLNLNLTMLRNTIQALEIQRATLSTIQSMGTVMGAAMKPGEDGKPAFAFPFPGMPQSGDATAANTSPFAYPNWPAPAPKPGGIPQPSSPGNGGSPAAAGSEAPAADSTASADSNPGQPAATDFSSAMAAPAAWWGMLQNQFMQAVQQAVADQPDSSAKQAAPAPNGKSEEVKERQAGKSTGRKAKNGPDA